MRWNRLCTDQNLTSFNFVPTIENSLSPVQDSDRSFIMGTDFDDLQGMIAQFDDITIIQNLAFIIRIRMGFHQFFHLGAKSFLGLSGRIFRHVSFRPEGIAAGMIKMSVRVDDHDRFVRDGLHQLAKIPESIESINQCRFLIPNQEIDKLRCISGHDRPGFWTGLEFTVNITTFVYIWI